LKGGLVVDIIVGGSEDKLQKSIDTYANLTVILNDDPLSVGARLLSTKTQITAPSWPYFCIPNSKSDQFLFLPRTIEDEDLEALPKVDLSSVVCVSIEDCSTESLKCVGDIPQYPAITTAYNSDLVTYLSVDPSSRHLLLYIFEFTSCKWRLVLQEKKTFVAGISSCLIQ
jgi:hypothetical protein